MPDQHVNEPVPHDPWILILDDEPLIAMSTGQMLGDLGYQHVDVCFSLSEAEQAAAKQSYATVILDVHLGNDQTSHALAGALRKAGARIVFVTGDADGAEALRGHCDHMISKPFGEADILAALA